MVVFLLAAIAAYLLLRPTPLSASTPDPESTASAPEKSKDLEKKQLNATNIPDRALTAWKWVRTRPAGIAILIAVVAMLCLLLADSTRAWSFVSEPEILRALLGGIAGALFRAFPKWIRDDAAGSAGTTAQKPGSRSKKESRSASIVYKWQLLTLTGGIAAIVLAAMLAPVSPSLLRRLTGIETQFGKFQFAPSPAEKELIRVVDRDLAGFDRFKLSPIINKIVEYECGYAALQADGYKNFKDSDEFQLFAVALALRNRINRFVFLAANAQLQGYDLETIKTRIRPLAITFSRLVMSVNTESQGKIFDDVAEVLSKQEAQFKSEGITDKITEEETSRLRIDRDPDWCEDKLRNAAQLSNKDDFIDLREIISSLEMNKLTHHTRYIHNMIASMFYFSNNIEGSINVLREAKKINKIKDDINVNYDLAEALYLSERDFIDVAPKVSDLFEAALRQTVVESSKIAANGLADTRTIQYFTPPSASNSENHFQSDEDIDLQIRKELRKRYNRAQLNIKLRLAYLWSQQGERLTEALAYARDNYDTLTSGARPMYICFDADETYNIRDTYAFVNLSQQEHNFRVHGVDPDMKVVREAQEILEGVSAELREQGREQGKVLCLSDIARSLWLKRISSHLRLAQQMLR